MFKGCSNLTSINVKNFNTANVKTMEYMFSGCSSLKDIDTSNFDVSLVTNMAHMYENCPLLTRLNFSNYITPNIENMDYMFANCDNLEYVNFQNLIDTNIKSMVNILHGTPENMVFCIDESNAKNLDYQITKTKGCSVVNCSENWLESRQKVRARDNVCVKECSVGYKYLYYYKCYERCPEGTFSIDYICRWNLTDKDNCTIKIYFLGKCVLPLNTHEDKKNFIESTNKEIMKFKTLKNIS